MRPKDKIIAGLAGLALGTSAAVGIVDHNSTSRADKNTCALKQFISVVEQRVADADDVKDKQEAIKFYKDLNGNLQPVGKCAKADYSP